MPFTARNSVAVLGVPFDNVSMDEAVAIMDEQIREGGFHQVATANVDFLMNTIHEKELQDILCSCDLVVPDGMPIVWAARMMGTRLKERVCGVDLVPRLAELAAKRDYGIYLLGADEKNSCNAAALLTERYPGLRIAGRYSPPLRPLEEMDHEDILSRIEEAKPQILLVAFGNPKQEKWLAMHRNRLKVPVCIGVGGTLDFLSGNVSRAPHWMQNCGLEWFHRVIQEPRRLARRYVKDAAGLAFHLPPQLAAMARQPRRNVEACIRTEDFGSSNVISIMGDFVGSLVGQFTRCTERAGIEDQHIVLDMGMTTYLSPDALGSLVHLMIQMKQRNRQLWLAEAKPHVLLLLRTARLQGYFKTTSSVHDAIYRATKTAHRNPTRLVQDWSPASVRISAVRSRREQVEILSSRLGFPTASGRPMFFA